MVYQLRAAEVPQDVHVDIRVDVAGFGYARLEVTL